MCRFLADVDICFGLLPFCSIMVSSPERLREFFLCDKRNHDTPRQQYKLDPNYGGLDDFRFHFGVIFRVVGSSEGFDFYAVLRRMRPNISQQQLQEIRQV